MRAFRIARYSASNDVRLSGTREDNNTFPAVFGDGDASFHDRPRSWFLELITDKWTLDFYASTSNAAGKTQLHRKLFSSGWKSAAGFFEFFY